MLHLPFASGRAPRNLPIYFLFETNLLPPRDSRSLPIADYLHVPRFLHTTSVSFPTTSKSLPRNRTEGQQVRFLNKSLFKIVIFCSFQGYPLAGAIAA